MQRLAFADATNPALKPAERSTAMKAWDILENRKRILRGKGLPKSIEGKDLKPKRMLRATFSE